MAFNVTWDTEAIPQAVGAYVSPTVQNLVLSQSQSEARTAIGAASSDSVGALTNTINATKRPMGGVHTTQSAGATVYGLSTNDLAQGGTQSFTLAWAGRVTAVGGGLTNTLLGSTRGITTYADGSAGIVIESSSTKAGFSTEYGSVRITALSGDSILGRDTVIVGVFDASTKMADLYVDGTLVDSSDWSAATLNSTTPLRCMLATSNTGSIDTARSPTGYQYAASSFTRALTPEEIAEYSRNGGKVVPVSARADCALHLTCDDGAGYQLRDSSGNGRNALLTETGCEHLIPGDGTPLSVDSVNASSATYLLRSGPVLPADAVVSGVIVDGEYLPAEGAQNLGHYRIRLNPDGGDLQVQRSDGTTHQVLATFTPASLASVNVTIIYNLVK